MSRTHMLGLGCLVALALGGTCASGAAAKARPAAEGPALELTERPSGTPLAVGAPVYDEQLSFSAGSCLTESGGFVRRNDAAMDRLTFEAPAYTGCEEGATVTGGVRQVRLYPDGSALITMNPELTISTAGPCAYKLRHLTGTIEGEIAYITGIATGRIIRSESAGSCARELTTEFAVSELGEDGYVLGAVVEE